MDTNYDIFNSKFYFLRKPRVTIFAAIIKILTISIEKVYKGHKKKLKELEIVYQNAIYICII